MVMMFDFLEHPVFPGLPPTEPWRRGAAAADIADEAGQCQRADQEKSGMNQRGAHTHPPSSPSLDIKLYRGGNASASASVRIPGCWNLTVRRYSGPAMAGLG